MSVPRFRAAVERARETAWLGRIVLIRPLPATVLTAALVAIVAGSLAFLGFAEIARKERVHGIVAPSGGLVRVYAPRPGPVRKRLIEEGERVAKGDPLFVVADGLAAGAWGDVGEALDAQFERRRQLLAEQRDHLRRSTAEQRLRLERRRLALLEQRDRLAAEHRVLGSRVALSSGELSRIARLENLGFVAPAARAARQEDLMDQEIRLMALERSAHSIAGEAEELAAEIASTDAQARAQLAAIAAQLTALEQERLERRSAHEAMVVAPQAGLVTMVLAEEGQAAAPGVPLASLVPEGARLEVHLFAPSRSIGFVREGHDVLLRFPAFPFQKFGSQKGRVEHVSRTALAPGELGFSPPDRSPEALFRLRVALASQTVEAYGRPEALQPGMQVEADIVLDRRRLLEWIFEPLFSLSGRL